MYGQQAQALGLPVFAPPPPAATVRAGPPWTLAARARRTVGCARVALGWR
jgi:hypothetical protein